MLLTLWTVLATGCGLEAQEGVKALVERRADAPALALIYRWNGEVHTTAVGAGDDGGWICVDLPGVDSRWLPLEIRDLGTAETAPPLFRSIERLPARGRTLRLGWVDDASPRLVPMTRTEALLGTDNAARLASGAHLAWICGVLLGVMALLRRSSGTNGRPWPTHPAASLALWIPLAVLWTWPAVLAGDSLLVGLHFDLSGTAWTLASVPRLLLHGLQDAHTAFPLGADYTRLDSYTLLALAWLTPLLPSGALHGLLQVGGVATGAWASERAAVALGARAPWSLLAGLGYAFSGLAATALLEGHVYQVATPWLPLFLWAWLRTLSKQGRAGHSVLAGLAFAATLLTSGYLGVTAAALALCLLPAAFPARPGPLLSRTWPAVLIALGVGALYLWLFTRGELFADAEAAPGSLGLGAANLASLAGAAPEVDRSEHSMALCLSGVMLALLVAAPALLERRGVWRVVLGAGLVSLLLALGPWLHASPVEPLFPLPTALLWQTPLGAFLRFPARLSWGFLACGGVVAALAGTALEARVGRVARLLVLLALLEPFLLVRLPFRQASAEAAVPSAYTQADGPVLELLPVAEDTEADFDSWLSATSCYYQTVHGWPIAEDCVDPTGTSGPRQRINLWLQDRLLVGDSEGAAQGLAAMGFAALAVHPDLLEPTDLARLEAPLAGLDPQPVTSIDGGESLRIYHIAGPAPAPGPDQRRAALMALEIPTSGERCSAPTPTTAPGSTGRGTVALLGWGLFGLLAGAWHLRRRARS